MLSLYRQYSFQIYVFIFIHSQVILKPDPGNSQDLFIRSLSALGNDWNSFLFLGDFYLAKKFRGIFS